MKPRRPADMGKVLMGMVLVQLVMVLSLLLDSTPVVKCVQGARHVDESLKRSAAFAQPASLQNVSRNVVQSSSCLSELLFVCILASIISWFVNKLLPSLLLLQCKQSLPS
jgi:hypothetical protein